MRKKYIVELTEEERASLLALTRKGKVRARKLKRAQILLLADEGKPDNEIAAALHVGRSTVERTRQKLVEHGLEFALNEQPRLGREPKLDDKAKAVLLTLAQSTPPEGRKRWTLQLLADRMVGLQVVDTLSDETVRRVLKKTN
jgi:transposase